jgi:hypothetical protein
MAKNRRIVIALAGILVFPVCWAYAGQKIYRAGTIASVEAPLIPFPVPLSSGQTGTAPVSVLHQFAIEEGDVLYVGSCLKKNYPKPKWQTGDKVLFRRDRDKMYLKKPGRGELELHFLMSVELGPNGKPFAILDSGNNR